MAFRPSIEALRQRLRARSDSEHEQALVRIVINIICIIYFTFILYIEPITPARVLTMQCIYAYFILALTIFAHIIYKPSASPVRRNIGIFGDMSIISFTLYMAGPVAYVSFPLYLWVTIGNGLRFGQQYLLTAMITAALGFSITFANSSYLQEQIYMGIGILLSIIALPIYYSILINRLNISNKQLNDLLEKTSIMATHDDLTGLANRNLFYDRLKHALDSYQRNSHDFAVFFVDLDGFKPINDNLGHSFGDKLLQQVANRIKKNIRSCDTASRFGGDEFVLLITNITQDNVAKLANKLITKISDPYTIESKIIELSASIGITTVRESEKSISTIIQDADSAMYQAKTQGKNRWIMHKSSSVKQIEDRVITLPKLKPDQSSAK